MPAGVSPEIALRQAKATADLYADAVARLLEIVARRLAAGIDQPGWAERKLLEVSQLRQDALAEVARLEGLVEAAVREAVTHGRAVGVAQAGDDLREARISAGLWPSTNTRAVDALVAETVTRLQGTHLQVLRSVDDIYRQTIAEGAADQVVAGSLTRRQAAQAALDRFARQGVTGFIDKAGRNWQLDTYAEMATRTAVGRAQVQGSLDRYQAAGKDLVIVSDAPRECPACRQWEGKVLSISGRTPAGTREGGMTVAGSVAAATGAGLFHVNCRHRLGLFVPGLSRPMHGTADPEGYEAHQAAKSRTRARRQAAREKAAQLPGDEGRPAPEAPDRRLNAGDLTTDQGRQIAASAMRQARGEITAAEHRAFVRDLTGTDRRGRRIP